MKKQFVLTLMILGLLMAGCATGVKESAKNESHFAKFGTNRVHYVMRGHGPKTVVLIHGWACNADFWREQVSALESKARLILIDLPGHGASDKPRTDYTMDYFASAVLAVMNDAHVSKATLVGHSMGTPIICRVYSRSPDRVAGLVAVDGILRRPNMNAEQAESFIAAYRTPEYQEHAKRFVTAMFPNPGTEALRDRTLEEMLRTPQYVMSSAMDSMFNASQPAWDLDHVAVPIVVINTKNPMWTADYQDYVRSLSSKTEYRTIEGAGHFLMLEKPAEFNGALKEGLEKFDLISR